MKYMFNIGYFEVQYVTTKYSILKPVFDYSTTSVRHYGIPVTSAEYHMEF